MCFTIKYLPRCVFRCSNKWVSGLALLLSLLIGFASRSLYSNPAYARGRSYGARNGGANQGDAGSNPILEGIRDAAQGVANYFQDNHLGVTAGVSAILGGNPFFFLPGAFGGGGFSVTITSDLQVIFTFSANAQGGLGVYAGVSGQLGVYYSDSLAPGSSIGSLSIHSEANFGAGASVC